MAKIALIKIGSAEFILPPKVDAGKLIAALAKAEHVGSRGFGRDEVFFPYGEGSHYAGRIELRYIDQRQIRATDPGEDYDDTLRLKG